MTVGAAFPELSRHTGFLEPLVGNPCEFVSRFLEQGARITDVTEHQLGLGDGRAPGEVVVDAVLGIGGEPPLRDLPETAAAWLTALRNRSGPTAILLTRQALPVLDRSGLPAAASVESGGYHGAAQGPVRRVGFGSGYVQRDLAEPFEENLAHFPVLLPILSDAPPARFAYLRLHNGTIWRWIRPVVGFDAEDGRVHLRTEVRPLPAGPTSEIPRGRPLLPVKGMLT